MWRKAALALLFVVLMLGWMLSAAIFAVAIVPVGFGNFNQGTSPGEAVVTAVLFLIIGLSLGWLTGPVDSDWNRRGGDSTAASGPCLLEAPPSYGRGFEGVTGERDVPDDAGVIPGTTDLIPEDADLIPEGADVPPEGADAPLHDVDIPRVPYAGPPPVGTDIPPEPADSPPVGRDQPPPGKPKRDWRQVLNDPDTGNVKLTVQLTGPRRGPGLIRIETHDTEAPGNVGDTIAILVDRSNPQYAELPGEPKVTIGAGVVTLVTAIILSVLTVVAARRYRKVSDIRF